ncbi:hypothetical protein [Ferribacterium limneticum]|uniref:hypothetical protein n=1 Tax=Ferribacterium limneticum TaxID=76259 RepID=UPI001CFBDB97|nr:hypothetical protein [Ferribacterium limneticum]UCV18525.1 hypothetical protein KI610_17285 [Ferribacterium limneticum]
MRAAHVVAILASVPGAIALAIDQAGVSPLFLGFPVSLVCLIGSLIIPAHPKIAPPEPDGFNRRVDAARANDSGRLLLVALGLFFLYGVYALALPDKASRRPAATTSQPTVSSGDGKESYSPEKQSVEAAK